MKRDSWNDAPQNMGAPMTSHYLYQEHEIEIRTIQGSDRWWNYHVSIMGVGYRQCPAPSFCSEAEASHAAQQYAEALIDHRFVAQISSCTNAWIEPGPR
jgi:hypothetical protein